MIYFIDTILPGIQIILNILSLIYINKLINENIQHNKILNFIYNEKKFEIHIAKLVLLGSISFIMFTQLLSGKSLFPISKIFIGLNWWADIIDPLIGITIVLITLGIWFQKNEQEWEDSLEKTLTVIFFHEGQEVLRCVRAYLSGESDIRAWGQQIGAQMSMSFLEFEPFIDPGLPQINPRDGEWFKDYFVVFKLRALPFPTSKEIRKDTYKDNDQELNRLTDEKNIIIKNINETSKNTAKIIFQTLHQENGCIVWYPNKDLSTEKKYFSREEFNALKDKEDSGFHIKASILNENKIISASIH